MRKAAVLLCVFCILLVCGCSDGHSKTESDAIVIRYPEDESINGYKLPESEPAAPYSPLMPPVESEKEEAADITYYYSKTAKKFHLKTCHVIKRININNLCSSHSRKELTDKGLEPCKSCKP